MKDVLIILGIVAISFWFFKGFFNSRDKRRNAEDKAYQEALRKNREARNAPVGSDLDRRVREQYGED